jgi:hypothetical protein
MHNFYVIDEMLQDARGYLNSAEEALNEDNSLQLLKSLENVEEIVNSIRKKWVMVE